MKRTVVDTNVLKSDKLREYLADSSNLAVFAEFAIIETLKMREPKSISDQLKIVAEHASRVLTNRAKKRS